ncbi:MAG: hypothetical protein WCF92_01310 [bacterium]
MSIIISLLKDLWDAEINYKGIGVNIFGIPTFLTHNKNTCKSALSRLKRNGYVVNENGNWRITTQGQKYIERKNKIHQQFDSPFLESSPKNLIVLFDIPEKMKSERDWLRSHLKKFNYEMIQKSVWLGPSPLPKEFVSYIKSINLEKCVKTFKVSKVKTKL